MALLVVLVSCGGPSKVAKEARKTFYPNNTGTFDVTLFNDASASCFEGSTWDFVSNNNRGTYEVSGADCVAGTRYYIWSIDEENTPQGMYDFLLKPVNENYKSTNGNQGFRLNLVSLTGTSMVWEQTVTLEGSPFVIRMMFTK